MQTGKLSPGHPDVFRNINGFVADILNDIANRPVPKGAEPVLAEIRKAVANGEATSAMALKLIESFPNPVDPNRRRAA